MSFVEVLTLRNVTTGQDFPRPVNIEKVVVVPHLDSSDLRLPDDAIVEPLETGASPAFDSAAMPDLAVVAYEFGKYLRALPSKSAISSQACKFIYERFPAARELLARHGRLRGLVKAFPYLQLDGGTAGGTYVLSLNSDLFNVSV